MKKKLAGLILFTTLSVMAGAQKYFTKDGTIRFFSDAKMEKIEATNNKATCVLDGATGAIEWAVLTKGFVFENAFMGEHFNETYMESDKFPKATFKGNVENMASVNLQKDGVYKVKVTGDMTMHGVTKKITTDATFTVAGGKITADSKLMVKASDYGIVIPGDKSDSISNNIEITVKAGLAPLNK
jgi:YceI-like domain